MFFLNPKKLFWVWGIFLGSVGKQQTNISFTDEPSPIDGKKYAVTERQDETIYFPQKRG